MLALFPRCLENRVTNRSERDRGLVIFLPDPAGSGQVEHALYVIARNRWAGGRIQERRRGRKLRVDPRCYRVTIYNHLRRWRMDLFPRSGQWDQHSSRKKSPFNFRYIH